MHIAGSSSPESGASRLPTPRCRKLRAFTIRRIDYRLAIHMTADICSILCAHFTSLFYACCQRRTEHTERANSNAELAAERSCLSSTKAFTIVCGSSRGARAATSNTCCRRPTALPFAGASSNMRKLFLLHLLAERLGLVEWTRVVKREAYGNSISVTATERPFFNRTSRFLEACTSRYPRPRILAWIARAVVMHAPIEYCFGMRRLGRVCTPSATRRGPPSST